MSNTPQKLAARIARWSDAKLDRELSFLDDNGGDPVAVAWCEAVKAEAARRGWL